MDREEKRIDITIEAVKQQITIASAIIAVVAALAGKSNPVWKIMYVALSPFIVSIVGGVFVLLTVPYALYGAKDPFGAIGVRIAGIVQGLFFCFGVILMVVIVAMGSDSHEANTAASSQNIYFEAIPQGKQGCEPSQK